MKLLASHVQFVLLSHVVFLEVMVQKALDIPGTKERLMKLPQELFFDSTCTGTGGFELASHAVCEALTQQVVGLQVSVSYLFFLAKWFVYASLFKGSFIEDGSDEITSNQNMYQ